MKLVFQFTLFFLFGFLIFPTISTSLAFAITSTIGIRLFFNSNMSFMFREWALFLYSSNYLLSPAITYQIDQEKVHYPMKITSENYFILAIPGFILFMIGMFFFKNRLFKPQFNEVKQATLINEKYLLEASLIGIFLRVFSEIFPGELGFFIYLISMIRFVGAFSLFALNNKKYTYLAVLVLFIEIYFGFRSGMYHDAIMWLIFFLLFFLYTKKPSFKIKIVGLVSIVFLILFIQAIKFSYREQVWKNGKIANFETISEVGYQKANTESLIGEENLLSTLNRGNQAWIFASTVDRMDRFKDFQGLNNVNKYIEAALFPRFLAPNKLTSGNKEIFNQFSGHTINDSTSMGLGIFADGYIAYGAWGVYIFGFVLGLIFSLTFRLVERWTKISPFYVLLLLPMLNYAVRPDCELQTTINHLAKSIVVFGTLVYFTKKRFTLESTDNKRKLLHLNLIK